MRTTRLLTGTLALLLCAAVPLHAQDPSARVARASYLQGDVSFRPGTVDDWTSATLNYPLTTGDHLWTDTASRAELQVGSNAIRLGPLSAFEILALDDNHVQIRLSQGEALVRVRSIDDDNIEIDTPTGAVSLIRTGIYRIDVSEDGATSTVTVRVGGAEVTTNSSTVPVDPQTTVLFTENGASPDVRAAAPMDEYDEWAAARDRSIDRSVSAQYVSRDMTGYQDLDANGSWDDDPDYGHVWIPTRVAFGWAPYRYGRWAWVEPWGWTWIDDAPWGFAPFHYGRWAYVRNRWVWAPGVIVRRPVYAPALVAFVGGSHFTVAAGWGAGGGTAWFPLAPGEVYRPSYRASDRYVRNVNVTNVHVTNINVTNVNVTNVHYRNQHVAGAVTAVSNDAFAGSRSIGRRAVVVPVNEASSAHVVGDGASVKPTRQSVLVRRSTTTVARPPERVITRQVVSKNTPSPRVQPNRPMSHADQPARATEPNASARPTARVRPNVNVQPYPQSNERPNAKSNDRPVTTVRPNVNVRAPSNEQPNTTARPAPRTDVNPPASGRSSEPRASEPRSAPEPHSAPESRGAPESRSAPEPRTAPESRGTPVQTERREPATPAAHAAPAEQQRQPEVKAREHRQPEARPDVEKRREAPEQEKPKREPRDSGSPSHRG